MGMAAPYKVIAIGVSAGGLATLPVIINNLPADFPMAVIVVQHAADDSGSFLAEYLNRSSAIAVQEAAEKEPIRPAVVYIAPPGYHLLVEEDATFSLSVDERVNYSRPSIDVLFESAAETFADRLIGLILTGASNDGSKGLEIIKSHGGLAIVQDPATAEADFMPRSAIQTVDVDHILPLDKIAPFLIGLRDSYV